MKLTSSRRSPSSPTGAKLTLLWKPPAMPSNRLSSVSPPAARCFHLEWIRASKPRSFRTISPAGPPRSWACTSVRTPWCLPSASVPGKPPEYGAILHQGHPIRPGSGCIRPARTGHEDAPAPSQERNEDRYEDVIFQATSFRIDLSLKKRSHTPWIDVENPPSR